MKREEVLKKLLAKKEYLVKKFKESKDLTPEQMRILRKKIKRVQRRIRKINLMMQKKEKKKEKEGEEKK